MKKAFIYLFLIFASQQTFSQKGVSQKAISIYKKALQLVDDGQMKAAIPMLQETILADTNYIEPILTLAGVYGELKQYQNAVNYFEKGLKKDSAQYSFFFLPYSINLAGVGAFGKALLAVDYFLSTKKLSEKSIASAKARKSNYQFAVNYAAKNTDTLYLFNPQNLGDSINTSASEYYPTLTIDDSLILFTRRSNNTGEDFYESSNQNKKFSTAKIIDGSINDEPFKGAINISQDGEWLAFAANSKSGYGNFDIYLSTYTPTGWSEPYNLGNAINTEFWESSPTLSPDKQVLYFSSDRPGGYGGKDLYISKRLGNGNWGMTVNMGASINTDGDELAPFIHADGSTLYFCSNGLPGYGNMDLYLLRKDSLNNWMQPVNLGYPINTIDHEGSLFIAANGKDAYYASDRADTRGGLDIYTFPLRKDLQPSPTYYVKGQITDKHTGKGLPCNLQLVNVTNGKVISNVQTDESGNYFITLPLGINYDFTVNRKGYWYYTTTYNYADKKPDSVFIKNIQLTAFQRDSSLILENVNFESNKSNLMPNSILTLNKVVQLLKQNSNISILVTGHTDNSGNELNNQQLSTLRAREVASYLLNNGIELKRLSYKGNGDKQPIASNNTELGKQQNRRTEIRITNLR